MVNRQTVYQYDGEGRRVMKVDCALDAGTCDSTTPGAKSTWFVYDAQGRLAAEYTNGVSPASPCTTCYLDDGSPGQYAGGDGRDHGGGVAMSRLLAVWRGDSGSGGWADRMLREHGGNGPFVHGEGADAETQNSAMPSGLDYFGARYFSGAQGRFTSPDEPFVDQWEQNPQSWNLYTYARNNPLRFVDPTGQGCTVSGNSYTDNSDPGPDCQTVLAGNGEAQQVTVAGKGGNVLVAFGINAGFALSNFANDYFAWMFQQRPDVLQNTPTSRAFVGQAATAAAFIGTAFIGPAGEASQVPREIKVTWKGLLHVLGSHTGGAAGKSFFEDSAAIPGLVKAAESATPIPSIGGKFVRTVDAGRVIGKDITIGQPTSIYTVVTDAKGELVTAFPGNPRR